MSIGNYIAYTNGDIRRGSPNYDIDKERSLRDRMESEYNSIITSIATAESYEDMNDIAEDYDRWAREYSEEKTPNDEKFFYKEWGNKYES